MTQVKEGSVRQRGWFLLFVMQFGLILALLAWGAVQSQAAPPAPYLVKDINTGTQSAGLEYLTDVSGTLFFSADDDTHGDELWTSDGSEAGTFMIRDIYPGANGSRPQALAAVGSTLFFSADDGTNGRELWKSDGTEAGTILVKDIYPGSEDSEPEFLFEVDGVLLFFANDGTTGKELWRSDGTEAGTSQVLDICPGPNGSEPWNQTSVAVMDNIFYFSASDCSLGQELWRSDGTEAGTGLVRDIYVGGLDSSAHYFAVMNGILYFSAQQSGFGWELWRSDGTFGNTYQVKDIYSGSSSSYPRGMTAIAGTLFFQATNGSIGWELWKSDGSEGGTLLVKDINPGSSGSSPSGFTEVDGMAIFYANDGTHGYELWRTDGTGGGTALVKDIYPGSQESMPGMGAMLRGMDGTAYFPAVDGTHGHELWQTDGTEAGTVLVKDIYPQSEGSWVDELIPVNGVLYFMAQDNFHGYTLWSSDGTEPGTTLVKDINTWGGESEQESLVEIDNRAVFMAFEGTYGKELWMSDGTEAGTAMVKDINPGTASGYPHGFTDFGDAFYFKARDDPHGYELWKSDGTEANTVLVKDINPGTAGSDPWEFTPAGGTLFFGANDGMYGVELWKTDGTESGTVRVKDIVAGGSSSSPNSLVAVGGTLFFRCNHPSYGYELWKSDGTDAGTVLVKDIYPGSSPSYPGDLTDMNGTLFLVADDGTHGTELWKSDGSGAGTTLVKDIYPGSTQSRPWIHTVIDGTLFFSAEDPTNGRELWKTGGTEANTVLVKDVNPGGSGSDARFLAELDGTLFFQADDGTHGEELWKSDGTEAGTVLVKDINPGSDGSGLYFEAAVSANGMLYFTANDGTHGHELWMSDGTEEGTLLVGDIGPDELEGGAWGPLAFANGVVFFAGDDHVHGGELWGLVVGPLDLSITKAVDAATRIGPGSPLTYTLIFSNEGTGPADGVVITDVLPAEIADPGYTSSGVAITATGGVNYAWDVARLMPGEGGAITITGIVSPSVSTVFSLTNEALITSTLGDSYPEDNQAAVTVTVDAEPPVPPTLLSPEDGAVVSDMALVVTWQPSPSPDAAGYLLNWSGEELDMGASTQYAAGALVEGLHTWTAAAYDDLANTSAYTDVWSFTVCYPVSHVTMKRLPEGVLFTGNKVRFSVGALGSAPFHYAWTVNGELVGGDHSTYDHLFESAGSHTVGVTVSNDCSQGESSMILEVEDPGPTQPNLSPSVKSVNQGDPEMGNVLTYTLYVRNIAEEPAAASLTDPIPAGTLYIPGSAWASDGNPVELVSGELQWSGEVISGTPIVVEFAAEVVELEVGTWITNTADVDDGLGNVVVLEVSHLCAPGYRLLIDEGALATNVPSVTLRYSWVADDDITHVQFSNDLGFGPGNDTTEWLPVNPVDPTYGEWLLATYGDWPWPCTVYARFLDKVGQLHGPVQDSIVYDPDRPTDPIVEIIPATAQTSQVGGELDALVRVTASDANSGIDRVQLSHDLGFGQFTEFPFIGPTTDVLWVLQSSGEVHVRVVDRAGNISRVTSESGAGGGRIYLPIVMRNAP